MENEKAVKVTSDNIDELVDYWHTHDTGVTLREFLGMTPSEYENWAKGPDEELDMR